MAKSPKKKHSGAEILGAIMMVIAVIVSIGYEVRREYRFNRLYELLMGEADGVASSTTITWPLFQFGEAKEETYALASTVFFLDEEKKLVNAFETDHTYDVVIRLSNQSTTKLSNIKIALDGMIDATNLGTEDREYTFCYITRANHKNTEVVSQTDLKTVNVLGEGEVCVSYIPASAFYAYGASTTSYSIDDKQLLIPEIGVEFSSLDVDGTVEVRFKVTVQSLNKNFAEDSDLDGVDASKNGFSRNTVIAFFVGVLTMAVLVLVIGLCTSKKSNS